MSGPASTTSVSSPQRTSASGIVHDEETQTRSIPQSRRADGSLRKERKVKPGYTPQEDIARFRSKRLMEEDARRAASGLGTGVPGSASWVAAATSPASGGSSSRYSSTLVGLNPRRREQQGREVVESKLSSTESIQGSEAREERPVKVDEPPASLNLDKPNKSEGTAGPAASPSAARAAPPRGLFARAMGGVTTQDRPREGRSTSTWGSTPSAARDERSEASAKTRDTGRLPRGVQDTKSGEGPNRRAGPRLPPSSGSEAQSWRRGPATAISAAKTAPAKPREESASRTTEVDPIHQLSEGLESLKVERNSSEK
ncbi:hypothetical protein BCV69DRAFT_300956 [Microstroma glucosiphilum]|uniref:WIBG Mago-binding domain-containing protein n=1 Tax=Pseudomicrostroma glucosiphilum TaxID=1684307 RepID=A0A316U0S2_9BASI|nr:hypothetical protein BCV69DRAFT_300956 [Pseudomicrostroma glucosiphilum]PWN18800.1 hypothetical protein BCV69DRAFT_300956 [Pseudomicrostroma glucosiphilum]